MQQQVLQDQKQVRLTEEEAALFVSLHAEREQKDGATTLGDLAETLRVTPEEAERLLAEVRARLNPIPEVAAQATPVETGPIRRKRKLGRWVVTFLLLLGVGFSSGVAVVEMREQNFPRRHRSYSDSFPGLQTESLYTGSTNLTVAVRTGNLVTQVYPGPVSPQALFGPLETNPAIRIGVEESIFEALDYASRSESNARDFVSVSVSDRQGGNKLFDIGLDGSLTTAMSTIQGRQSIRDRIHKAVGETWPPHEAKPSDRGNN